MRSVVFPIVCLGTDPRGYRFVGVQYGADLYRANLYGAYLREADLSKADLWRADLRVVNLYKTNLSEADLSETDLREAILEGANLQGANLYKANLTDAKGIVCLGTDPRGYRFVGVQNNDGWRISDGCRWFIIDEAKAHWANNTDALARINTLSEKII
jgi:uncharacterized protein YjbI with pentapeptide repeats